MHLKLALGEDEKRRNGDGTQKTSARRKKHHPEQFLVIGWGRRESMVIGVARKKRRISLGKGPRNPLLSAGQAKSEYQRSNSPLGRKAPGKGKTVLRRC